ncbi:MAG TPA: hypothetical protein VKX46_18160 [Ktedonobacteraceae bacterium]|nr:hypothetical protein [Ktedonobacteraceae bacterium]
MLCAIIFEEDTKGAIVGAIAFVVTAIVLSLTLLILPGALALVLALVVWLLCALGLYAVSYKAGWLRVQKEQGVAGAQHRQDA